jgi:hypothetical protein
MKKLLNLTGMMILLILIPFINAEISFWTDTILDNSTSVVRYHSFYQVEDTSPNGVGKHKPVVLQINYETQSLPYNLTLQNPLYSGSVDWCNFTILNYQNIYDNDLNLINTSIDTYNEYITTGISETYYISLFDRDSTTIDMDCHFTDVNYLYVENFLAGRFTTFFPSFECKGCEQYTIEQLSNEADRLDNMTIKELAVYNGIQKIIDMNFKVWVIFSWFIKIGLLILSLGLIFAGVYYLYKYFDSLSKL